MKQDDLQHSEKLASYFAPRREEASLLSTEDVEKLLSGRVMLPNRSLTVRRIIMTLTGMAGLAAIGYFTLFNNATDMSSKMYPSYKEPAQNISQQHEATTITTDSTKPGKAHVEQIEPNQPDLKPRWSAPANQVYADLSPSELSRLGIFVSGDTIFSYKRNEKDSVERSFLYVHPISSQIKGHGIGGGGVVKVVPQEIHAPTFYPVLMTYSNGNGAAYRIEQNGERENAMIGEDNTIKAFRSWLQKPGTPGYKVLGFTRINEFRDDKGNRRDSVFLTIGKDFPQPPFMPFLPPEIEYPDSVKQALMSIAPYYEGSSNVRPHVSWPKSLIVTVDTVTPTEMVDMMDRSENTSVEQHMRSIMARLNELVPVIVRMHGGSGAPKDDDFIFWYEPSEELFAALPQSQANIFREKLNEAPRCLTSPNSALQSADVTYCVDTAQEVQIYVRDLKGEFKMLLGQRAHAGDNIVRVNTETLPSGIYIVTVRQDNGTERSKRIWVENAHPKSHRDVQADSTHAADYTIFMNDGKDSIRQSTEQVAPLSIGYLYLDSASLAKIGLRSDSNWVTYYTPSNKDGNVISNGVGRSQAMQFNVLDLKDVPVSYPSFRPVLVTDGFGHKRITFLKEAMKNADASSKQMEAQMNEINSYVPVLLRASNDKDSIGSRDLIFWYKPTPEFLEALPESAREKAIQMANVGDPNHRGTASVKQMAGVIEKAVAYPNPSKGKLTLQMTMGAARKLTFTLLNLLGQERAHVSATVEAGSSSQPLDFSALDEGVYLLDITSDAGEEMVQRIVIAR